MVAWCELDIRNRRVRHGVWIQGEPGTSMDLFIGACGPELGTAREGLAVKDLDVLDLRVSRPADQRYAQA